MNRIRKVVFPVGGLGTRFLPATKVMPKEMLPVVDKPLIQYAVEEASAAGITDFIFVTARGKSLIEDHFDHVGELNDLLDRKGRKDLLALVHEATPKPGQAHYTRQQQPLGLGHAVWCARRLVGDEPFAVILPDDLILSKTPCLAQMVEAHASCGGNMAAVMEVPRAHTARYGVLEVVKEDGRLVRASGLVEKPKPEEAPSTLSIIGRYILMPEIFEHLEKGRPGAGGEIQLTDAMADMMGTHGFHGFRFEGTRFDCGDKLGFVEATLAFALEREDLGPGLKAYLKDTMARG